MFWDRGCPCGYDDLKESRKKSRLDYMVAFLLTAYRCRVCDRRMFKLKSMY